MFVLHTHTKKKREENEGEEEEKATIPRKPIIRVKQ